MSQSGLPGEWSLNTGLTVCVLMDWTIQFIKLNLYNSHETKKNHAKRARTCGR